MIFKKITLFFLGCTIFFSCKDSKIIPIIDLDVINHSINLDITDILKDITMVQINADFLLSTDDQIYITSNYLIIMMNSESLHLFSRDGQHIRKLAERGNGPGEFRSILYWFVDEEERILYYVDNLSRTRLNRIDIGGGTVLDPLQIDFTFLTVKYINGKIYSFPLNTNRVRGRNFDYTKAGDYPDSAIVASSISLPSGEIKKYHGHHKYTYQPFSSSITSYYDEITLLNLGYSDTLFTLNGSNLNPLCVLTLSDKMRNAAEGGSVCEIISAYNIGIVLSKYKLKPNPMLFHDGHPFFALYDRNENVFRIDNIHVMGIQISLADAPQSWLQLPTLLPITRGKYGYMLVERDILESLSSTFDLDNDNPVIIMGMLK